MGKTAAKEFTDSLMGTGGAIGFSAVIETAGIMFLEPLAIACVTAADEAEDRATKLNISDF